MFVQEQRHQPTSSRLAFPALTDPKRQSPPSTVVPIEQSLCSPLMRPLHFADFLRLCRSFASIQRRPLRQQPLVTTQPNVLHALAALVDDQPPPFVRPVLPIYAYPDSTVVDCCSRPTSLCPLRCHCRPSSSPADSIGTGSDSGRISPHHD